MFNFANYNYSYERTNTIRSNTSRFDHNHSSKSVSLEIIEKKRAKILIVDDNCYNSEATKNILNKIFKESRSERDIIICSDGVDILYQIIQDQSRGNEIKCIITDENMEYINGSEAIRIIRNLERCNKIKFVNIISATGNDEYQYTSEIIKAGAQLVLSKPIQKATIKRALEELNII